MNVTWYYFLSWWIFLWFILFKLNFIPYSPFLIYVAVIIYIILKIIHHLCILKKEDYKHKNFNSVVIWMLIAIIIDIVPIFFLKHVVNVETIIFTLCIISLYITFMSYHQINVIKHYVDLDMKKLMNNYDSKKLLKDIFNL